MPGIGRQNSAKTEELSNLILEAIESGDHDEVSGSSIIESCTDRPGICSSYDSVRNIFSWTRNILFVSKAHSDRYEVRVLLKMSIIL